jgi:hypothetical protein
MRSSPTRSFPTWTGIELPVWSTSVSRSEYVSYIPWFSPLFPANWSFPEREPSSGPPKDVGHEIEFMSYYQRPGDAHANETDGRRARAECQLLRNAMGAARDWMSTQPDYVAEKLWEHDFDWTAPEVTAKEEQWEEDD